MYQRVIRFIKNKSLNYQTTEYQLDIIYSANSNDVLTFDSSYNFKDFTYEKSDAIISNNEKRIMHTIVMNGNK